MARNRDGKGISLAKGPVLIIGLAMIAFGILALLSGATGFAADPPSGTVSGDTFLGLEVNGWSSLLFVAGGALLVFGSPLHWGAKTMSLIVGAALIAAAVLAFINQDSALGIFAANGLTELVWLAAGALLLLLALLLRVGGGKHDDGDDRGRRQERGFSSQQVDERVADNSRSRGTLAGSGSRRSRD